MKPPTSQQATTAVIDLLAELFSSPRDGVQVEAGRASNLFDASISVSGRVFLMEYKSSAAAGPLAAAIGQVKRYAQALPEKGLPLLVVPFMGPVGQKLCDQSGISWLDLSGNANIAAPGLTIRIEGRRNKYGDRGRPPNVFSPKSSRIARQLLLYPEMFQTQAHLARQTGLGDGYVSKIVSRLRAEQYVDANETGAVRPRDPNLLLDAWQDAYDFNHQRILKGHVPARSGEEILNRVVQAMTHEQLEWAVTGLSAAWLYTGFAAFRLTTLYLSSMPSRSLLEKVEFSDEPKGANLWLVLPDDDGVFHGSETLEGIRCVSAVQTYLDLKGQPERAKAAAIELRKRLLNWRQHGT